MGFFTESPWISTPYLYRKPHTVLLWIIFGDLVTSSNKNGRVPRMAQRHIFHYIFSLIDHQEPWSRKGSLNWLSTRWVCNGNPSDLGCEALTPSTHSPLVIFSIHIVPPYFENFKVKRFWPATLCSVLGYSLWKTAWQSK